MKDLRILDGSSGVFLFRLNMSQFPFSESRLFRNLRSVCGSVLLAAAVLNATGSRPNIVFFMVDDMGWQDTSVGFHSARTPFNEFFRTPSMERLAQSGVRLTQAYSCAVCTPTRVSWLIGQNATRHHVTNWTLQGETSGKSTQLLPPAWKRDGLQPGDAPTAAGLLREAGYRTIHVGKAHWGAVGTKGAEPLNLGFDVNIAGHAAGAPESYQGLDRYGEGKGSAYEGGIRVPAIVSWAEPSLDNALQKRIPISINSRSAHPVIIEDLFPTFLKWAGAALPKDTPVDGEDITPWLAKGSETTRSSPLFWHFPNVWTPYPKDRHVGYQPHSVIRSGDWKAIYFYEPGRWELYNIANDLAENDNLADKEPARLSELAGMLLERLKTTQSPWPVDKATGRDRIMKLPGNPQ